MKLIVNINLRVCYRVEVYVDTDGNVLQKTISTVNTVESGNLHSVTSNAVAEKCISFPNYSQRTLLTDSTTDGVTTNIVSNGWIYSQWGISESNLIQVNINGIDYILSMHAQHYNVHYLFLPVKKGDKLIWKGSVSSREVWFIPFL